MCAGGELPSKILNPFKQVVGLDDKIEYFTIGHYTGSNAHYLNNILHGDTVAYYDGHGFDEDGLYRKTQPFKYQLEEDLSEKLQMIVLTRSHGVTEWMDLQIIKDTYIRKCMQYYEDNGEIMGISDKPLDIRDYANRFDLTEEQRKKVEVYYNDRYGHVVDNNESAN